MNYKYIRSNSVKKDKVGFVVNIPKYVPRPSQYSEDSSIGSLDQDLEERLKDFNEEDLESYPYRTYKIEEKSPRKNAKDKDQDPKIVFKAKAGIGVLDEEIIRIQDVSNLQSKTQTLFDLMAANAFESQDKSHLDQIKVVIGLNRIKSLSSRNNKILSQELSRQDHTDIRNEKFAFFWEALWYSRGNNFGCNTPRDFYKKLKAYDEKHRTSKAKKFLDTNEKGEFAPTPPYQDIREHIKKHSSTETLVSEARGTSEVVYYSFIDDDVINFNGVYSAYFRILEQSGDIVPHVMSTGYEFHGHDENYPYRFASHIDRLIRVATAQELPTGVYYPEPNFCVLLPKESLTLPYGFLDSKTYSARNMESPVLIRNLLKETEPASLVFSDDNYLIIATPIRAKYASPQKQKAMEERPFSREFLTNLEPNSEDINGLAQVTQSTLDSKIWAEGLYYNRGFVLKSKTIKDNEGKTSKQKGVKGTFVKLMSALRAGIESEKNLKELQEIVQDEQKICKLQKAAKIAKQAEKLLLGFCEIEKSKIHVDFKEIINQLNKLKLSEMIIISKICNKEQEQFYRAINTTTLQEILDIYQKHRTISSLTIPNLETQAEPTTTAVANNTKRVLDFSTDDDDQLESLFDGIDELKKFEKLNISGESSEIHNDSE